MVMEIIRRNGPVLSKNESGILNLDEALVHNAQSVKQFIMNKLQHPPYLPDLAPKREKCIEGNTFPMSGSEEKVTSDELQHWYKQ